MSGGVLSVRLLHLQWSTSFKLPFLTEHSSVDEDMLRASHHQDEEFVEEYSQFHISLDDIISPPQTRAQLDAADDNHSLLATVKLEAIQLLGVQDGSLSTYPKLQVFETPSALTSSRGLP
jgi:hypothetical protein